MASAVQSLGSTTAVQIEDDASSKFEIQEGFDEHDGDGYETPNGQSDMPYCLFMMTNAHPGGYYEPECDTTLQPSVGMIFDSWEQGKSFYKAYAHNVGFSVRTWTQHKDGDVVKLKKFICSKEGWRKQERKKENEQVDQKPKRK
ncbi:protein FAR1-RELATED SEQUENCE 5 [Panicum miliaceum]|uniref:Protein FAR1-RELATED SEQUENCE 5 n=1 Tax=Panicum miliaceum TaxID=4540 RepID=A0A3L6SLN2_PANMI|nr:protein FAR1-RELATED SEQUENCE 5 [Panicum miliaceum]